MVMDPETKVKEILHISRHWDNLQIRVAIHKEGIEIETTLENFCIALAQEVGSPKFMFKQETLQQKMLDSIDTVLSKIKEASAHV